MIHKIRKGAMEKQALAKRRREEAAAGSMEEDRISQLPQTILHHHILSLLSQKEAFRTCILSKSWRHLGPTRPKFDFRESYFPESNKAEFLSVLQNTLQRYDDQKLPIQEFILRIESNCSISLLKKWIPKVIRNLGVKTFSFSGFNFSLPSVVFRAEFLTELYLEGCKLSQIKNCIVNLQVLKRLSLNLVYIEEKAFEKIMSSCPSIQYLVLVSCFWLNNIRVKKALNLKYFVCYDFREIDRIDSIEIDDATSLETIHISRCHNWHSNNYFFPRLKSLYLWIVHVPTELLNNLSSKNCPCLEELQLHNCSGFSEFFKLSNHSIKRLVINEPNRPIKAVIDAANMLCFEFRSNKLPSISFSTTPRELESKIEVWRYSIPNVDVFSTWLLTLYQFLKALGQSRISLDISYFSLTNQETKYGGGGSSCEPVVVEHLFLGEHFSSHELPAFLNILFRTCRPRYIGLSLSIKLSQEEKNQVAESIWKTLVNKGETWQQDLEESSIQVSDNSTNENWHPVQVCAFSDDQSIRFRLKWRDLS